MGRRSARRIALEERVLAILRDAGKRDDAGQRLPTSEVAVRLGLSRYDGTAWRILHGLERDGRITRHRDPTMRIVFWSVTT